jgi:hypothetical protein
MFTSADASEITGVLSRSYPGLNELVSCLLNLTARAPTIATWFAFVHRLLSPYQLSRANTASSETVAFSILD